MTAEEIIVWSALLAALFFMPIAPVPGTPSSSPSVSNYYQPMTVLTVHNTRNYTYGGTPVVPLNASSWLLNYPARMQGSGMFSGTDIVSLGPYSMEALRFYATFTGGDNSHSNDEMVVFCTDTLHYNGTEYGIRYMLNGNMIYGYTQASSQTFKQIPLMPNDGATHRYDVSVIGYTVTFTIDGVSKGSLNLYHDEIYGGNSYWVTIAVHRYSAGWNSSGYKMLVNAITIVPPPAGHGGYPLDASCSIRKPES